jgi:hypothetical protein
MPQPQYHNENGAKLEQILCRRLHGVTTVNESGGEGHEKFGRSKNRATTNPRGNKGRARATKASPKWEQKRQWSKVQP